MYEINNTPEDHGYTIRLVKRTFTEDGKKEIAETIATLAIIWEKQAAEAQIEILNTFIAACVENKVFAEDLFRHLVRKR